MIQEPGIEDKLQIKSILYLMINHPLPFPDPGVQAPDGVAHQPGLGGVVENNVTCFSVP